MMKQVSTTASKMITPPMVGVPAFNQVGTAGAVRADLLTDAVRF